MSGAPPGAYGTTILIGYEGYLSWAETGPPAARASAAVNNTIVRVMSFLPCVVCIRSISSVRYESGRLGQRPLRHHLVLDEGVEFGRGHRHRLEIEPGEPLAQPRRLQHLDAGIVQLVDDSAR